MGGKSEELDEYIYYKEDIIGHGAFALVYKGRHKTKNFDVAVKAITKKNFNKTKNLLAKEIKILKQLSELKHENLVSLLKCTETSTNVLLVMEYCNGGDLAEYLHGTNKLSERTIRHFFSQIAEALKAMHEHNIVHRDLKPQNILLCQPPNKPHPAATDLTVKLADFGFARFLGEGTMAVTLCGSPMYMAPEVIMSSKYDAKADLWSIGTIIYQCLVGQAPFVEKTPQALKNFYEKNIELRPKIPDDCSPHLKDLLLKLLKRNARDRIEFSDFFKHPFLFPPISTMLAHNRRSDVPSPFSASNPRDIPCSLPNVGTNYQFASQPRPSQIRVPADVSSPAPRQHVHRPDSLSRHASGRESGRNLSNAIRVPATFSPSHRVTDSDDFTLIPAPQSSVRQQHIQYSNGSAHAAADSPVKQVQVHSNAVNVRAVPVPSQRQNFTIMEHRRTASKSPSTPSQPPRDPVVPSPTPPAYLIENIQIPETRFVIPDQSFHSHSLANARRFTATDLAVCSKDESSPNSGHHTPENMSFIPKSATSVLPLAEHGRPPVDNIQYLSTSPSRTATTATVKILSPTQNSPGTISSDEEGENDQAGNNAHIASSSSQIMESVSGNETGTTTSSDAFPGAGRGVKPSSSGTTTDRPVFGVTTTGGTDVDSEAMFDADHHRILNKLQFIYEFIEILVNVADNIANPIAMMETGRQSSANDSDIRRRSEQIVLYVRAMYILTSALNFSEQEITAGNLHVSAKGKHVLNQLNDKYHYCLTRSQELASLGIPGGSPTTSSVSAEGVLYRHALDLCQTAALDELFGKSQQSPKRYQTAYMMLHTLSEQVQNEHDRGILARYKNAVEKRLRILETKGFVTAITNN